MSKRKRKISASRKKIYADRVKAYNEYEEKVLRESWNGLFQFTKTLNELNSAIHGAANGYN